MKSKLTIDERGTKMWRLPNGSFHREDGPAIEDTQGYKAWWINGELHREDGPAVEWGSESKEWWLNGELHREDGPAIDNGDDYKWWYLNNVEYTEQEYKRKTRSRKLSKLLK